MIEFRKMAFCCNEIRQLRPLGDYRQRTRAPLRRGSLFLLHLTPKTSPTEAPGPPFMAESRQRVRNRSSDKALPPATRLRRICASLTPREPGFMPSRRHARPWRLRSDDRGRRPNLAGGRLRVTGRRTARARRADGEVILRLAKVPTIKKPRGSVRGPAVSAGRRDAPGLGGRSGRARRTNAIGAGFFPPQTPAASRRKAVTSGSRRSYNGENYP